MVKIPHLSDWQNQTKNLTFKQLENFAKIAFTPIVGQYNTKDNPETVAKRIIKIHPWSV